jgi:hypothetical protein
MYRCTREKKPQLVLSVTVLHNGALQLACDVPKEIESRIMVAMRNSLQKKCYRDGKLEILISCLRNSSPSEKEERLKGFCERLTRRSDVEIIAQI